MKMYRNKKDVDKHVESLMYKLTPKDFKTRALSIAHLYYEVGDYKNCIKFVEQFISQKSDHAAAYKLLGQAYQKIGEKEKALEQYKTSFDINPNQTSIILDICDLLTNEDVTIDLVQVKHWCEKAQASYPNHSITYRLREKLLTVTDPNPQALVSLLKSEIESRPNDVVLHARLLKHYLKNNKHKEAFEHSCYIEFNKNMFSNNYAWHETLSQVLKYNPINTNDWLFQLLLLTVKERLCALSLTEAPSASGKSLVECCENLHTYDQAIQCVAKLGSPSGFGEFYSSLLQHHEGQLIFHVATYLLKKAKRDQLSWREAKKCSELLMLLSWQIAPVNLNVNWLKHAPEKQKNVMQRWYLEDSYRSSQVGHYLIAITQNKSQIFLDQISQTCSGSNWKDKLYEKTFTAPDQQNKTISSYLVSNALKMPALKLPRKVEVQLHDENAQREHPSSLHHFAWILLNYKNYADFKLNLFDMLTQSMTSCGPETLNKLDVLAFLYCSTLSAQKKRDKANYNSTENILPANISNLLCSLPQMKWWDCAYKLNQNELGSEYTDIRSTLSRGIETVRCIDNHGLDPELLTILGRIFDDLAKSSTSSEEITNYKIRAYLYYSSAIPLLEKLKNNIVSKVSDKRMFDYIHEEMNSKQLNNLLEECKLYVALNHVNECEYDKAIIILSSLKSPQALYHLSDAYKRAALEKRKIFESHESENKFVIIMEKAKKYAYKCLDKLKEIGMHKNESLYSDIQVLVEEIELHLSSIDPDLSPHNDGSSDETNSISGFVSLHSKKTLYRNVSSTPKHNGKQSTIINTTAYRTATDTHVLDNSQMDPMYLERIEKQIKNLQKRDASFSELKDQTKNWFEENRKIGNQIISTINSNIESTTEQFKVLKLSLDQVKDQIDEYRNECKDVVDLKKQVADLKKEVNKLKKPSSEQTIKEHDLYNLGEDYRSNDNTSNYGPQLPFPTPQVLPPFTQRLMPPFTVPSNPYQLYGQNFYNLYNQYPQFPQQPTVPAPSMFDASRAPMNYPGIFPTPEQMYLDAAQLVPTSMAAGPAVPTVPVPALSTATPVSTKSTKDTKDTSKSLPVNVVITSSDPLPTSTTAPPPVLSVTIPQKHIKGGPHNYQIPMPVTTENKVNPSMLSFATPNNKTGPTTSATSSWISKSIFMTAQQPTTFGVNVMKDNDHSKNVDGTLSGTSPNTSVNKSRTLSEKSNTSIENYDPCPDFKPIIPLPDEVKVTTGEEDEEAIFSSRAKLFRFVDKQWKERGIGDMKLLKHKVTGKVRVLMRREQVHKICANHIIVPEIEIKPMKNENKAYFWVANDFAEETVILEKFCVRFKSADIAKEFYDTFEKARIEAINQNAYLTSNCGIQHVDTLNNAGNKLATNSPAIENVEHQSGKTVVGGFTFTAKPSFKVPTVSNDKETKSTHALNNKVNVFSSLTFKSASSSPLSTLANITMSHNNEFTTIPDNNLNKSDVVEEFVPTTEFKPVVPLPALIEQKTGEENELVLFEHRAKLLRFDSTGREWKERGIGNIKLLANKDNNLKVRLLMRREQIMKVCCNHTVSKDMTFQKMPKIDKAVTWCAQDFSEGELVAETFCLRFKTVKACNDFIEAVQIAQSKIGDDSRATKEEQNGAKQNNKTGFGDQFKPKSGSWYCEVCYTNNLESFTKCACCETQKPGVPSDTEVTSSVSDWGAKFKPKPGTWECKQCCVRNEGSVEICVACNSPNGSNAKKNDSKPVSEVVPKFKFGIPSSTAIAKTSSTSSSEFTFGIPQTSTSAPAPAATSSLRNEKNSNALQKFVFGTPQNKTVTFGIPTSTVSNTNANLTKNKEKEEPLNFSMESKNEDNTTLTPVKPALLSTPVKANITPFGNESSRFEFSFKPKLKSPKEKKGDESDDNEYASEDEGHHIHFSPVIPLPDKVDVVTGEEDEDELYGHRARLFRFTNGEWKERGTGVIKILKHNQTDKLRVVMRREQVLKICLNHALVPDIKYKCKDERTWLFVANDFSEGEVVLQNFCIRFANKEIATQFKDAIDKALKEKFAISYDAKNTKDRESEDVIFVTEIQATNEEKKKAKELMLPENFYAYKNKDPCQGCRGCNEDDDGKPESEKQGSENQQLKFKDTTTPLKASAPNFQSPNNSVYGTPSNANNTIDTTMFRTPLTTNSSNSSSSSLITGANLSTIGNDSIDKENTLTESSPNLLKPVSFVRGGQLSTASVLAPPKLNAVNVTANNNTSTVPKSGFGSTDATSIFSSTELITPRSTEAKSIVDNKAVFGENKSGFDVSKSVFGDTKPVFGENKSAFGESKSLFGSSDAGFIQTSKTNTQSANVKSIFSSDGNTSVNLFGGGSQGSLFGPAALSASQSTGIFGNSGKFTFGPTPVNTDSKESLFGQAENQSKQPESDSNQKFIIGDEKSKTEDIVDSVDNKTKEPKKSIQLGITANVAVKEKTTLATDNALSFESLSTSGQGFGIQKKTNFQWEGAGQQLFVSKDNANKSKNDTGNDSGAGNNPEEEYDPHYEPIVPLPDRIVVTTGEEDEEKIFGERCKLYRFDEKTHEWKERGVGEMKVLYQPERKTYRLLLRREQVHKAVLNMLVFMDLELLPLKNSDRAWSWAGMNYAESGGEQETLAVRFKSVDLATAFRDKVMDCVRKLQVAAAEAIRKEKEANENQFHSIPPMRLPKHIEGSQSDAPQAARAHLSATDPDTPDSPDNSGVENLQNEQFQEVHYEDHGDYEDEDYEHDYDHNEDSDGYYNEDEDSSVYYPCKAVVKQGAIETTYDTTHVFVSFDQDIHSPKILVTVSSTGEILADMLIHTDTEFQLSEETCSWSGIDYTTNVAVEKFIAITFPDSHTAMEFYDSCETSKAATFASTDPES